MSHKLAFCFILLFAWIVRADSTADLRALRDLTLLMKLSNKVCPASNKIQRHLSSAVQSEYQDLVVAFQKGSITDDTERWIIQKAKTCQDDCTCQALLDISNGNLGHLPTLRRLENQTSAMTEGDYIQCQAQQKVDCRSAVVKKIFKNAGQ